MSHRPIGSGDHTLRLAPRADQAGMRLFIGRSLYQALGCPARVDLAVRRGALVLTAGGRYAVAGAAQDAQPRLSVGARMSAELGIDGLAGAYEARHFPRSRRVVAPLGAVARGRPAASDLRALRAGLGLTQAAMAARLGVPAGTLANWESRGRRPNLSPAQLDAVASLRREEVAGHVR